MSSSSSFRPSSAPAGLATPLTSRLTRPLAARLRDRFGGGRRPLRIAYGRVFQESNAFSPTQTTRASFEAFHCLGPAELERVTRLRGRELVGFLRNAELSGFRQAARLAGAVETVPLWSTLAVSGGPVTTETFQWLVERTLARLRDAGPLDGVYLALHGSMQVQGLATSPEGVLLERVRRAVGSDVAIAVSYDLHANFSEPMLEHGTMFAVWWFMSSATRRT